MSSFASCITRASVSSSSRLACAIDCVAWISAEQLADLLRDRAQHLVEDRVVAAAVEPLLEHRERLAHDLEPRLDRADRLAERVRRQRREELGEAAALGDRGDRHGDPDCMRVRARGELRY
jgi:hypothetical protein